MFKEENITGKSNLEVHNSLSSYLGYAAQQNPYAYKTFYDFFETVKPSRILEIGTALGGFTAFLKLCCNDLNLDTNILTYEVNHNNYSYLKELGIDTRIENIFTDNYNQVKQEVIDYIQQDGVTVILCDGGWKIGEFNLLSKFIKPKDFILAHDYASTSEYFKEHINMKFWNWHEIQDSDIQESVEKYNLESFMQEEFTQAVWVCKIKK